MHTTSLLKMQAFFEVYVGPPTGDTPRSLLDVGSAAYNDQPTYRPLAERFGLAYTGLDMRPGPNVDLVAPNPYVYDAIPDDSFDIAISGQAFEHNPFFWATFCEIARVTKAGGLIAIVAPGAGRVHRYPFDCWRFYPDSWMALCALAGLKHRETVFEPAANRKRVDGAVWRDSLLVAEKPTFADPAERAAFNARLAAQTAPFRDAAFALRPHKMNVGPLYRRYAALVDDLAPVDA